MRRGVTVGEEKVEGEGRIGGIVKEFQVKPSDIFSIPIVGF